MKIPENPPAYLELLKTDSKAIFDSLMDVEVSAFLAREEQDYNYWDKFKYLPMPKNLAPEIVWACREMRNMGKMIPSAIETGNYTRFHYTLLPAIEQTLHQTDRNIPYITEDLPKGPGRETFIIRSLMEEAIASSQIEGAAATRRQAKEMLETNKTPKTTAEQMILNNYKAITHIRTLKDQPLSEDMLLDLHRILSKKTLKEEEIGRFRQSPQDDNVQVIDSDGAVLYTPPQGEAVRPLIKKFIAFANNDAGVFIHPLVKGILLHFWLAYIHPFRDGNGRTARAIFYWYMLKKEYWAFEYLSISRIALHKEGQYKRAFLHSELSGDLTYFLLFNAKIINEAAEEVAAYIKRKLERERSGADLAEKYPALNTRQRAVIAHAKEHAGQVYTIRRHQSLHNISYATARADILGLAEAGLFTETGTGKTREFLPVKEKLN